eukprot:TRINITY_DN16277_c0_g1_i6.p1 TRINITY_DN16277_c0_g1~~TRINITY_DN16277_c0_g1_i6.p1  ORF type:complete len:326 (+),score=-19.65 TRINITY_DN16277_c0_g1_i6:36-980(+)
MVSFFLSYILQQQNSFKITRQTSPGNVNLLKKYTNKSTTNFTTTCRHANKLLRSTVYYIDFCTFVGYRYILHKGKFLELQNNQRKTLLRILRFQHKQLPVDRQKHVRQLTSNLIPYLNIRTSSNLQNTLLLQIICASQYLRTKCAKIFRYIYGLHKIIWDLIGYIPLKYHVYVLHVLYMSTLFQLKTCTFQLSKQSTDSTQPSLPQLQELSYMKHSCNNSQRQGSTTPQKNMEKRKNFYNRIIENKLFQARNNAKRLAFHYIYLQGRYYQTQNFHRNKNSRAWSEKEKQLILDNSCQNYIFILVRKIIITCLLF